jgi:Protein of unknown function (DUF3467)
LSFIAVTINKDTSMAKDEKNPQSEGAASPAPVVTAAPTVQPTIEPEKLDPIYANFARVTGSPEELVLDFGLNTQPIGNATAPVKISLRLVMNYFTAKRLWMTLGVSLHRHEEMFGVLETDIGKRLVPPGQRQQR